MMSALTGLTDKTGSGFLSDKNKREKLAIDNVDCGLRRGLFMHQPT